MSGNPVTLTAAQFQLARHALGLPNFGRTSYRNHFLAGENHPDFADWRAMVECAFARERPKLRGCGGMSYFSLTLAGAKAALQPGERLDREDFPELER